MASFKGFGVSQNEGTASSDSASACLKKDLEEPRRFSQPGGIAAFGPVPRGSAFPKMSQDSANTFSSSNQLSNWIRTQTFSAPFYFRAQLSF